MDDSSIAGRTEKLRREIELIRQEERRYRNNRSHSLAENAEQICGSFESLRSVKNFERLSKEQSNNQATDQSGTVDFLQSENLVHLLPHLLTA